MHKNVKLTTLVPTYGGMVNYAKAKHDAVNDWGFKEESDKSDENADDIPRVSTSDEDENKDDDDDDQSADIKETDDERTYSDNGDQAMTDTEKNIAKR
ncbi:hypothetical protein Tco_1524687 [Tanacetum coccineum]